VTRTTSDGKLKLIQTFVFNGFKKMLQISMTLQNMTLATISGPSVDGGVVIARQVDFDIDTGGADGWAGFINDHARTTHDGVFAWNNPGKALLAGKDAHGMVLRHEASRLNGRVTSGVTRFAKLTPGILDTDCVNPGAGDFADEADIGERLEYHFPPLGPFRSVGVHVAYNRY
jgi:hypothetical protein